VPAAVVHVLPKPEPVAKIVSAQAAAEAAHQDLMSSGRLAETAATNELLSSILTTYSTVQRLYHKAVKPLLDLHPQYVSSPAGEGDCETCAEGVCLACSPCSYTDLAWLIYGWPAPYASTSCQLPAWLS